MANMKTSRATALVLVAALALALVMLAEASACHDAGDLGDYCSGGLSEGSTTRPRLIEDCCEYLLRVRLGSCVCEIREGYVTRDRAQFFDDHCPGSSCGNSATHQSG